MAIESIINLGSKKLKIIFTFTGHEKYYLDDQLLAEYKDKPSKAKRIFDIDGDKISVDFEITKDNYHCQLFKNDELLAGDVFPEWTKAHNK
jgi:hypothetical protein